MWKRFWQGHILSTAGDALNPFHYMKRLQIEKHGISMPNFSWAMRIRGGLKLIHVAKNQAWRWRERSGLIDRSMLSFFFFCGRGEFLFKRGLKHSNIRNLNVSGPITMLWIAAEALSSHAYAYQNFRSWVSLHPKLKPWMPLCARLKGA
jgi:hypothetical protein